MSQNIQLNDLPSKKFDALKKGIDYDILQRYKKNETSIEQIDHWINEFKSKIKLYLTEQFMRELNKTDKGCKDFNYIIEQIRQKIYSLVKGPVEQLMFKEKIKDWRENYFRSYAGIICKEGDIYVKTQLKDLYDFCEDYIFVKEKLIEIKKSDKCQIIIDDIYKRKDELKTNQEILERQINRIKIRDIPCSPKILDENFSFFNCTFDSRPPFESGVYIERVNHVGSAESSKVLRTPLASSLQHSADGSSRSLFVTGGSEANSDSSSNAAGLVSLPIFGVLALFFFIYKYTPLGSKFHAYFRNKDNIFIYHDNESTEQVLSNTSNSSEIYSENVEYNVSYQTS
ncbi:PIR Superfamily Protein [Plasmodium ovale wallikeri]|uniref:PIR Superfamily Protein n=2 Tax=Plasmodium ovale TaxID=36330 RepID=A0A1A9AC83_PLAOA|nr:PIR Superfamily Protein [Plasmodium ovale wallikeri]SBT54118.1 PIR Superfamily Protein [Plasmodium ovale wallikeri]SBT74441.1 Plasmodium vivax Vir protein, putative [Plasmodium ovale]